MIDCEGKNSLSSNIDNNYCPFIETLSFGSDINIKCNSTYLIFNEINSLALNWKFTNQTSICKQAKTQQAFINQCGVKRIDSNYLQVSLKSLELQEEACIYCRINYKPIAPTIIVTPLEYGDDVLYTFNITATGLARNESFEILWAKRVNDQFRISYNYWFLEKCMDQSIRILENAGRTIKFTVEDTFISRVEFIIRRCNGTCRRYDRCNDEKFRNEMASNYFHVPDSIEKISCDSDCLSGIVSIPTTTYIPSRVTTKTTITTATTTTSTTTHTSIPSESHMIIMIISGVLLLLFIILLSIFIIWMVIKKKGKTKYDKANNKDPDEHK
ncbi:unnamed protein product [Adineta steineri]|uniref:Uncharacterized protein n=2 Tax=Adineta steineri TaxID=433720 RepID=A0A818LIL7_9BILA|nr:unnamed protein product [Adineta steineri]